LNGGADLSGIALGANGNMWFAGYVFVGWIGCKSTGATTCEVDVTAATEVIAVFLKEGTTGATGPTGMR
jgi:hypothetical protein